MKKSLPEKSIFPIFFHHFASSITDNKKQKTLQYFSSTQRREFGDMSSKNDREWSGFSIYLALPLEHCLSAESASLREAAYISVCRKNVGTNVFFEDISSNSLCVSPHYRNYQTNKNFMLSLSLITFTFFVFFCIIIIEVL